MGIIPRREITVPNILTLIRIIAALVAMFIVRDEKYAAIAAGILIGASILDYFDGWYARKFHQKTRLGAHLDPFADKVLIAAGFLILCDVLQWRWFNAFVAVILAREVAVTVYRMIIKRRYGRFLPAGRFGKIKTAVQCIVADAMLFYIFIFPAEMPPRKWIVFTCMAFTTFVTIDSGLRYMLPACLDGKKRSVLERLLQLISSARAREA